MQTKLQLELIGSLKRAHVGSSGWSLMELLIVVAIVGVLSVLSLPKYLQARTAVYAGSKIGEQVGQSKACATWLLSGGIGENPNPSNQFNPEGLCELTNGGTYRGSWGQYGPVSRGLRCLQATKSGGVAFTIWVTSTGGLSCKIG